MNVLLPKPKPAAAPEQGVAFTMHPIGVVHSSHRPRGQGSQALQNLEKWSIEIFPRFTEVLEGLEVGAEVWLLTFHIEPDATCAPTWKGGHETHCKATPPPPHHQISPVRFTQVRLLGWREENLRVEGPGIEDGTPILDIRPALCPLTRKQLGS